MIGKRAIGADAKLLGPFFRSIGSRAYFATRRLVYAGPSFPESERMNSVIAHRWSGGKASANDGMGVPFNPVLIVLKMSSRVGPPLKVQGCERSAGRIGRPSSSVNVADDGPSARPRLPWHLTQPLSTWSFFPISTDALLVLGALGRSTGFGTL